MIAEAPEPLEFDVREEFAACAPDDPEMTKPWLNVNPCGYFIYKWVKIFDQTKKEWIPFKLWDGQWGLLDTILTNGRVCVLKGRQLGITWMCLSIALWLIIYRPGISIGLYSMREEEAMDLLRKLRGMFEQLPSWMTEHLTQMERKGTLWTFSNKTEIRALSTSSGDSYQFGFAVVDEADLVPDLDTLLTRLKPALNSVRNSILALISRVDKTRPKSEFKKIYRLGKLNIRNPDRRWEDWVSRFLPYFTNPNITQEWYEGEKAQQMQAYKHLDDLYTSYPGSDVEALAPSTSNKRIMRAWVIGAYERLDPLAESQYLVSELIHAEFLKVYKLPEQGRSYIIGSDCSEGLPTSDNAVSVVVDKETGEECASLIATMTPRDQAWDTWKLSEYYNDAWILAERNNHGHAMIVKLDDHGAPIMEGPDERWGYNTSTQSKIYLYTQLAETFKQVVQEKERWEELLEEGQIKEAQIVPPLVHTAQIADEIMGVERLSLKAPPGEMDDCAVAFAMAQMGRILDFVDGVIRATYTEF